MIQIRAFLFDFDGVLADTETLHWQGLNRIAQQQWGHAIPREEYDNVLIGYDDRGALQWLAEQAGRSLSPADLRQLVHEKQCDLQDSMGQSPLLSGAADIWEAACKGYRTAIVSAALRSEILSILRHHKLPEPDVLVAAEDTPVSKPDPAPYLSGFEQLNKIATTHGELPLHKTNCLVFEDTAAGIAAARTAGLWTVRLASGAPAPQPDAPQPHLTISAWQQEELASIIAVLEQAVIEA